MTVVVALRYHKGGTCQPEEQGDEYDLNNVKKWEIFFSALQVTTYIFIIIVTCKIIKYSNTSDK